ncbi:MAG TPA: 30S ribosomal protein S6 [Acidimicrobiales bacterium]|nr:30S ribosomal protein S6 [Acidimicrobiales bacterium]
MRPYEVMIILDPTLDDESVRTEVDNATELIKARGGNPGRVERWGKRRLAYEIRKHREGNYVLVSAQAEPATMSDLDRHLTLADGVLRHKVVHLPEKALGKPARALGTVGPDDGAPTSEPAAPTPAPAAVAAGATTGNTVAAEATTGNTVAAE